MAYRNDRGALSLGVIAPIVAALIGGGTAIVAASQIVSLAPKTGEVPVSSSTSPGTTQSQIEYGSNK